MGEPSELSLPPEDNNNGNIAADRIKGAIFGFALGDAVGFAMKNSKEYPHSEPIKGYPVGDWTALTDQLIVTFRCFKNALTVGNIIGSDQCKSNLAASLLKWSQSGLAECGDSAGHGITPSLGLIYNHDEFVSDPIKVAGDICTQSRGTFMGNAGLLRACIPMSDPQSAIESAVVACAVTHCDVRCISCAVIAAMMIHGVIFTSESAVDVMEFAFGMAEKSSNQLLDPPLKNIIVAAAAGKIDELKLTEVGKTDHVYKCLAIMVYAMQVIDVAERNETLPSFSKVIKKIASFGGDCDANCAAAGMIIGAYVGYNNLPLDWVNGLSHAKILHDLVV